MQEEEARRAGIRDLWVKTGKEIEARDPRDVTLAEKITRIACMHQKVIKQDPARAA